MAELLAYHGDPTVKAKYLERVGAHRVADELIHGTYWSRGKGCAVGCTVHSDDHGAYERELGIPRILARLEDGIFEGLPREEAQAWPEQFLATIPVGADLAMVWPRFAVWLLGDPTDGVVRFARTDQRRAPIQGVVDLYAKWVATGERPARAYAAAAYAAAYTAADTAADTAAAAAAAAYAAAYAAAAYAAAAAAATAYAAYADAARRSARSRQAAYLLTLLREAPVNG